MFLKFLHNIRELWTGPASRTQAGQIRGWEPQNWGAEEVGAPKPGGPPGVPVPRGVPGKDPPVPGKSPHGEARGRVSLAAFLQFRRPAAAAIRRGWRRPIAACGTRTRTAAAPRLPGGPLEAHGWASRGAFWPGCKNLIPGGWGLEPPR